MSTDARTLADVAEALRDLPCAALLTGPSGEIVDANRTAARLLAGPLVGEPIDRVMVPDAEVPLLRWASRADGTRDAFHVDRKEIGRDLLLWTLRGQPSQHDPLLRVLVEALRASATGTEVTEPNARILWVNRAFCELTGYSPEEVIGKFPIMLRPEDADPAQYAGVIDSVMRGEVWRADIRRRRKDGTVYDASITATPVMDSEGRVTHLIAHHDDVSELRRTERALSDARQRAAMADRLASIGTLAAGVGHELNNPLAFVLTNLEYVDQRLQELVARLGGEPRQALEEVTEVTREALEGAQRMRDVVRDLRTFARADDETCAEVNLQAVLGSALNLARHTLRHRAKVVQELGLVPKVWANPSRLGQVFLNLLINAAQAIESAPASPHHEIVVRTFTLPTGWAAVEVSDTGGGVPHDLEGRIFDPFVTTKPIGLGTGLGLSICRNLVTAAGGTVSLENRPGAGATFRVTLPPSPPQR